ANFSFANDQGEANLGAIYLYPGQQSKGIGTAMLQEGINQLDGVVSISVEVEKDNAIGKSFYEAKGFETVDEYDDEIDGYIMKTNRMLLHLLRIYKFIFNCIYKNRINLIFYFKEQEDFFALVVL